MPEFSAINVREMLLQTTEELGIRQFIEEPMKIVAKYQDRSEQELMNACVPAELQTDGLKLTAFHMNVGMAAEDLIGQAKTRYAAGKASGADTYSSRKLEMVEAGEKVVSKHLEYEADSARYQHEIQGTVLERKGKILLSAAKSIEEIVQMIKKVSDRLFDELHLGGMS